MYVGKYNAWSPANDLLTSLGLGPVVSIYSARISPDRAVFVLRIKLRGMCSTGMVFRFVLRRPKSYVPNYTG